LFWTGVLSVLVALILASAFSAILVYAQDLAPGRVGTISGVFFGLVFGLGGVGAAVLGQSAIGQHRLGVPRLRLPPGHRAGGLLAQDPSRRRSIAGLSFNLEAAWSMH
jgi:hypothetical protein